MRFLTALSCLALSAASLLAKPTIYLIGDSTVKNGTKGQKGWGEVLPEFFDAAKVDIVNKAIGGRSSRTFLSEGRWEEVKKLLKPGDFVLMQFGHNDGGGVSDTKNRASLKGMGDETQEVTDPKTGAKETVHTFGWYLNTYASEAKATGATPITVSLIPRNMWKDGKVGRASKDYALWPKQVAEKNKCPFLPLNDLVADHYDKVGEAYVLEHYFKIEDHTHTIEEGARKNAEIVSQALAALPGTEFKNWLKKAK